MFGAGVLMMILAGSFAVFFSSTLNFGHALGLLLPRTMVSLQGFVTRSVGADLWYMVVYPVLELPCWAPIAALGTLFLLIGFLRRA
ncbi:MAG: hypothetical protein JWO26_2209 [Rhodospirillales bacterium]|jgi:hypothetical protein|nr:hypothetical protein [Rhodospirillales bacterium]MDB5382577.1 hypothetical protein [Rhodospirillales bacterium]